MIEEVNEMKIAKVLGFLIGGIVGYVMISQVQTIQYFNNHTANYFEIGWYGAMIYGLYRMVKT